LDKVIASLLWRVPGVLVEKARRAV